MRNSARTSNTSRRCSANSRLRPSGKLSAPRSSTISCNFTAASYCLCASHQSPSHTPFVVPTTIRTASFLSNEATAETRMSQSVPTFDTCRETKHRRYPYRAMQLLAFRWQMLVSCMSGSTNVSDYRRRDHTHCLPVHVSSQVSCTEGRNSCAEQGRAKEFKDAIDSLSAK